MNRSSLARRYLPLAVVVGVQLLIIATVPSKAPRQLAYGAGANGASVAAGAAGGTGAGALDATAGGAGTGGGPAAADAGGTAGAAGSTGTGGSGGAASAGGGAGAGGTGSGGGAAGPAATGDTSHCVGGRQYDPKIAPWAPPCVPGKPGESFPDNGGATYTGVTGDQVTIVDYVTNYGAEVNAILQAQGSLVTYDQAKTFDAAMQNFINKRYTLYGRKVKIVTYQGQCQSVPPNYSCLLPEMDRIIQQYKPYMLFWNTTLCSSCFAEIARNRVIAVGGDGFTDAFAKANAPFFYDAGMSATRIEQLFGEFWCKQMTSVGTGRKVKWGGTQNPAQNFNGQPRRLGVISTNDPDNQNAVKNILGPALAKCGDKIWHTYFYAQDINTAAQQVEAGIAAMDTPNDPANVVLCLCDQVAPAFLYQGEQRHNYYPENVIATNQSMDFDDVGQGYEDDGGQPSLACPTPAQGCEYDNVIGLSPEQGQESASNNAGVRIFKDGGGGSLPISAKQAFILARQWVMMANLIEATGPNLNPQATAAAAPKMGSIGGGASNQSQYAFPTGSGYWSQDVRVVYWNKNAVSPYNGKKGSYIQMFGRRFGLGELPGAPDGPPAPLVKDRR